MDQLVIKPNVMNITSGRDVSIWFREVPRLPQHFPISQNENCDVAVIGGGIAGLTTAYLLSQAGKSVVLIEDGDLCSGESGRTSAHLASGVDDRYSELEKNHGKESARHMAEAHSKAIDLIESIVKEEHIKCDFERVDGYLILSPEHNQGLLESEMHAARNAGLQVAMTTNPVPNQPGNALRFSNQAQFHPTKYLKGLAEACVKKGVKIYTNTRATEFEEGSRCITYTNKGYSVSSDHVVVATNSPCNDRVTMHTKLEVFRTYMITCRIPKGSVKKFLVWTSGDPYEYVRVYEKENDEYDYLLVGGQDHYVGTKVNYDERFQNLSDWAKQKFPMITSIVDRWSGQILEPVDDIAFLGRNPGSTPNVYIITGDSGNGLTHAQIGGMIIRDMVMGKQNPWEKTFDPSRLMTHDKTEFVKHNIHVQAQYKDWITPGDISDIEDLKPGCGGILRKGLHKIACYRDDSGHLHTHSAVCPHLKAIVSWNDEEKTFDCPAHGSRFDPFGMSINCPARVDLTPVAMSSL